MSSDIISKDNLNYLLNELAKEYKREYGRHAHAEIVLVGGAAILARHHFRQMSGDIDYTSISASVIKEVANRVGDRLELPSGWLNNDFVQTESFSHQIYTHSKPYKTFAQVLSVRVMTNEYLIAMKLKSGRGYKNDISDVIGIMAENKQAGNPISFEQIDHAMHELYGGWDGVSNHVIDFIRSVSQENNLEQVYDRIVSQEAENRAIILEAVDKTDNQHEIAGFVDDLTSKFMQKLSKPDAETLTLDRHADAIKPNPSFVMLCGIPGSGKTEMAQTLQNNFPGEVQVIGLRDICTRSRQMFGYVDYDYALSTVEQQMRSCFQDGRSVIYDASNLMAEHRRHWLQIADNCGVSDKKLIIMKADMETALANSIAKANPISRTKMQELQSRLDREYPSEREGWSEIHTRDVPAVRLSPDQIAILDELNQDNITKDKKEPDDRADNDWKRDWDDFER